MEEKLIKAAEKLKETMESDVRTKKLLIAEKSMENDEEVMRLSYAFSVAQDEYNDILRHFSKDSEEAKKYQHKLFLAKQQLDLHPLVQAYLKCYQEVRKMYDEVDDAIFRKFHNWSCINEKR